MSVVVQSTSFYIHLVLARGFISETFHTQILFLLIFRFCAGLFYTVSIFADGVSAECCESTENENVDKCE